jgi:site-specific recombinase XerD
MVDEFKRYLIKDRKSKKTILSYINVIEEFEKWYKENHNCDFLNFSRRDMVAFEHYLEYYKKYKSSTIKVKLSALSKLNEFLIHNSF